MVTLELIIGVLGGLGIGQIIQSIVTYKSNKKSTHEMRCYQEKRESYIDLLDAIHLAGVHHSEENAKNFARWQTRVKLFGSEKVAKHAQEIADTTPGTKARHSAYSNLLREMRADLGVRKDW